MQIVVDSRHFCGTGGLILAFVATSLLWNDGRLLALFGASIACQA
jgi:hypothetical protein